MKHLIGYKGYAGAALAFVLAAGNAFAQKAPPTTAETLKSFFTQVNKQILDMAEDFPADRYDYRLKPEMRSFGEVIIHVTGGNVWVAKTGRGEQAKWAEIDPKQYKTKDEIVALFRKSVADANAALAAYPEGFGKNINPWMGVIEHSAEHYGLLVAYYRANGMVPPESRPKTK